MPMRCDPLFLKVLAACAVGAFALSWMPLGGVGDSIGRAIGLGVMLLPALGLWAFLGALVGAGRRG